MPGKFYFKAKMQGAEDVRSGTLGLSDFVDFTLKDKDDKPLPNTLFTLTTPDGAKIQGRTDANGHARVDGVATGQCDLEIKADAPGATPGPTPGPGAPASPADDTPTDCEIEKDLEKRLFPYLKRWKKELAQVHRESGIDPFLVGALMAQESKGGESLKPPGPAGVGDFAPRGTRSPPDGGWAYGLMAIDRSIIFHREEGVESESKTSKEWGLWPDGWKDPLKNIRFGVHELLGIFASDVDVVIAAYNCGPQKAKQGKSEGNVDNHTAGHCYWRNISNMYFKMTEKSASKLKDYPKKGVKYPCTCQRCKNPSPAPAPGAPSAPSAPPSPSAPSTAPEAPPPPSDYGTCVPPGKQLHPLRQKIIATGISQVGLVSEVGGSPPGTKKGWEVLMDYWNFGYPDAPPAQERHVKPATSRPGQWCGVFCSWVLKKAGALEKSWRSKGTEGFMSTWKLRTDIKNIVPGDICVHIKFYHHSICTARSGDVLTLVQGNGNNQEITNPPGQKMAGNLQGFYRTVPEDYV